MVNIAGQVFGRLTAIRPTEERAHRMVVWEFRCVCGATVRKRLADRFRSNRGCGCKTAKVKVLDAVQAGARTAREVEACTDLPLGTCSAYLSMLHDAGVIKPAGECRFSNVGGAAKVWELA